MRKPRILAMEKARAELLQTKGYYWKCWRKPISKLKGENNAEKSEM